MIEKQTNRFTDFTFGFLGDREVRWEKTKNGFHYQGQMIAVDMFKKHRQDCKHSHSQLLFVIRFVSITYWKS